MQLWPFTPEGGIKETLEWKTEVIRSRSAEQRIALRPFPRTKMSLDFILNDQEYSLASTLSKVYFLQQFLIPLWKELKVVGPLDPSVDTISINTTVRRLLKWILIMDEDGTYVLADILQIDSDQVTFKDNIGREFTNAFVVPLGQFHFSGPLEIQKGSEGYYKSRANFISTTEYTYQGSVNYPIYNNFYVVTDRPVVKGEIKETYQREFNIIDNKFGNLYYTDKFDYPILMSFLSWRNINLQELYDVRYFLTEMKGKQGQFWVPTWNKDFIPSQGISSGDDYIQVEDNNQFQHFNSFHIAILLKDETIHFRKVISMEILGAFEQLNLDTTLGVDISLGDIDIICKIVTMRSDSDNISIDYLPSGNTEIRIPVMEVPNEL